MSNNKNNCRYDFDTNKFYCLKEGTSCGFYERIGYIAGCKHLGIGIHVVGGQSIVGECMNTCASNDFADLLMTRIKNGMDKN